MNFIDMLAALTGQGGGAPAPTAGPGGFLGSQPPQPQPAAQTGAAAPLDPGTEDALNQLGIGPGSAPAQPQSQPQQSAPSMMSMVQSDPVLARLLAPRNPVGDVVDKLFGGPVAASRRQELQQHLQYMQSVANAQRTDDFNRMSPADRVLASVAPASFGKLQEDTRGTHTVAGGSSLMSGNGADLGTAPLVGFDPLSGRGYSVAADGENTSGGQQLGGDYDENGLSKRTGDQVNVVKPQIDPVSGVPVALSPSAARVLGPSLGGGYDPTTGVSTRTGAQVPVTTFQKVGAAENGNFVAPPGGGSPSAPSPYAPLIAQAEQKYGLPPGLLNGVITRGEASGVNAVSPKGAIGVAQLTPATARALGVDPRDPAQAIDGAGRYLARQLKTFGKPELAVAAYNAGPGAVQKYGGIPPFAETQAYVPRVMNGVASSLTGPKVSAPAPVPGLPGLYQRSPDGTLKHMDGTGMTTDDGLKMGKAVLDDPSYRQAQESGAAFNAMTALAKQKPGGMRAYALRDTFARTINPGAVARSGTIEAIKNSQGIPANLQAYFMNLKGDGDVPPQIVQQILSAAAPFAQSHWDAANALNSHFSGIAKDNGLDPRLATAPLGGRPSVPAYKTAPQVGVVERGYRFRGGDPSNPASWAKAS